LQFGEKILLLLDIIIIIVGKTALFELHTPLENSARLHLVFTLDFVTNSLQRKVVSLASNRQPGGPGPCIYVPQ
jgi:hypothetical protein